MQVLIEWFSTHLAPYVSEQMAVFLVSLLPLLELRGGFVLAALLDLPPAQYIPICIIGNIIPIPFILLFIKKIFDWLRPTKLLGGIVAKLENKAMNKSSALEKGEFIGLVLFVGIPLPGTGAWTGALIASLLGIDLKKSSLAILCGIALASVIMFVFADVFIGNMVS